MFARARSIVRFRDEGFGASVYVADRDDIFLIDKRAYLLVASLTGRWKSVAAADHNAAMRLAEVGIIEVKEDDSKASVLQRSYSGIHLFGDFADVPLVNSPLLVNCFSTSWCPLRCVYCHADDLMTPELRANENSNSIKNVVDSAVAMPALVYVVTGGDPLTQPKRTAALSEKLPSNAGVVLDTSGAGLVSEAVSLLKIRPTHLRVSIDSMDPRINKKTRPVNRDVIKKLEFGATESLDFATRLIEEAGQYAAGLTVQTVISSKNDSIDHLVEFRDWLISRGVKNWVLHLAINAGAARRFSIRDEDSKRKAELHSLSPRKAITILPDMSRAYKAISYLVDTAEKQQLTIDIRCTSGSTAPNSVFLIGSEGSLYTQGRGPDGGRKVKLFEAGQHPNDPRALWTYISPLDHVQRYINYVPMIHGGKPKGVKLW